MSTDKFTHMNTHMYEHILIHLLKHTFTLMFYPYVYAHDLTFVYSNVTNMFTLLK